MRRLGGFGWPLAVWPLFSYPISHQEPSTNTSPAPPTTQQGQQQQQEEEPQGSAALIPPILAHATGTVLDVGPGTGTQIPVMRKHAPGIKTVYGAEPCRGLHEELRAQARREGFEGRYHVLSCGVSAHELDPELRREGLIRGGREGEGQGQGGVFDTIVCVRVLCSVPDLEQRVKELYNLLRPGGKLLFVEHVVNPWQTAKGSVVARIMQSVYQVLGWSWFMGDCCLVRDTERVLRRVADEDGGWRVVDVERSFGWSAIAYISGVLVKR